MARYMSVMVCNVLCTFDLCMHIHVAIAVVVCIDLQVLFGFAGSTDGKVHVWNTETGAKVSSMSSDHTAPVQCIQFNPKYMMMASACTHMVSAKYGDISSSHVTGCHILLNRSQLELAVVMLT